MFIYEQLYGKMWHRTSDPRGRDTDELIGQGYSGAYGITKNNPEYQDVHNEGPIPQGTWTIMGPPIETASHGPFVLHLFPEVLTKTFGRSGFLIHGDSILHPGKASEGCIILPLTAREQIWQTVESTKDATL